MKKQQHHNTLKLKRLGIDTQKEFVIYMRADCHVCISEGFQALTRIVVENGHNTKIVATLNIIHSNLLGEGEASLSESAFKELKVKEGDQITLSHLRPIDSLRGIRAKMYGQRLSYDAMNGIITDITKGIYSNIDLAAFVSSCAGDNMSIDEIVNLTQAMINVGERLHWDHDMIMDKHCVGGLPGNRTTPIVVAVCAAFGLIIPKTSSRAITSPSGTADTVETVTPVSLSMKKIKEVVNHEGGCMAWGGAVQLSPADDILIGVEKALDIDSEGQMIASVLSKKVAAGSTHVIIDMPVGPTAKVRNHQDALKLKYYFYAVGHAIGLNLEVLITDGTQPVGRGIGPALEAKDVLAVLRNETNAPQDLRERALLIAGAVMELSGKVDKGQGTNIARAILENGKAYEKFHSICIAQGGFVEPGTAPYQHQVKASKTGKVKEIDNRRLAKIAKLAGAPKDALAGIEFFAFTGTEIKKGHTLFTIHSQSKGEMEYALDYLKHEKDIIVFE